MNVPEYSLIWDSFKVNICDGFTNLQQQEEFVDMTLAADGHYVKVHRTLIALASPYLKEMITSIPCQHPVIFLNNISYDELCYTLEYIYTGQVQIPKDKLNKFLKICKSLHIKGIENDYNTENTTSRTSESTIQPALETRENTNSSTEQQPQVVNISQKHTSYINSQSKAITRGALLKNHIESRRKKSGTGKIVPYPQRKVLNSDNIQVNEVQETNEHIPPSPGLSEFLTTNREQNEANQKDDSVSLSDFFVSDKEKTDMEGAQSISLDGLSDNDLFLKDSLCDPAPIHQSNKELFPGKTIDICTENGSMFHIKVLPQNEFANTLRTNPDVQNGDIENTENFEDIKMEEIDQEVTPNENATKPGCPTFENFEDIIDEQNNDPHYKITLNDGKTYSIRKEGKANEEDAINVCVNSETCIDTTKLTDADIKDSCRPLFTISNRGSLQLILNRFMYACHHRSGKDQSKKRWRCIDYRQKHCKAFLDTDKETVLQRVGVHTHPFHDKQILKKAKDKKVYSSLFASTEEAAKIMNCAPSVTYASESDEDNI